MFMRTEALVRLFDVQISGAKNNFPLLNTVMTVIIENILFFLLLFLESFGLTVMMFYGRVELHTTVLQVILTSVVTM